MAADCLTVMDELGWESAHVMGHSLGGMIAVKVSGAVLLEHPYGPPP